MANYIDSEPKWPNQFYYRSNHCESIPESWQFRELPDVKSNQGRVLEVSVVNEGPAIGVRIVPSSK